VKGQGLVASEPKSDRGKRRLKLPPRLAAELREHRRRQQAERLAAGPAWADSGFVFTTTSGGALDGRNLLRRWKRALRDARLPDMPFHASRHTAASILLAQGVDLRVVMEVLGHSQIALTANTYAHVLENLHDDAAAKMDTFLSGVK
jgi:integrase